MPNLPTRPLSRRQSMMPYIVSLGVGLGIGMIYAMIDVRSPAPPLVALVGLLGMVLGEQAVLRICARPASPPAVSTSPHSSASANLTTTSTPQEE